VKNLGGLMKQAQALQKKMQDLQAELGERTITAQAGGGMVEAVVNGRQELVSLKIDPEVATPDDVEMLQDLVLAAVRDAMEQASALTSNALGQAGLGGAGGGLDLGGLLGP